MDKNLNFLKNLIGCRINTHYGTGGIVIDANGPCEGTYTINYKKNTIKQKILKQYISSAFKEEGEANRSVHHDYRRRRINYMILLYITFFLNCALLIFLGFLVL